MKIDLNFFTFAYGFYLGYQETNGNPVNKDVLFSIPPVIIFALTYYGQLKIQKNNIKESSDMEHILKGDKNYTVEGKILKNHSLENQLKYKEKLTQNKDFLEERIKSFSYDEAYINSVKNTSISSIAVLSGYMTGSTFAMLTR